MREELVGQDLEARPELERRLAGDKAPEQNQGKYQDDQEMSCPGLLSFGAYSKPFGSCAQCAERFVFFAQASSCRWHKYSTFDHVRHTYYCHL